ncbi:MAG TPA: NifU family protein [Acidimicrobiales bacterium]
MEAALLEAVDAIRPALQADGGDMRVIEFDEERGVVDIELLGACGGCPMSSMTLKAGIERILRDRVPGLNEVRAKGIDFDVEFAEDADW